MNPNFTDHQSFHLYFPFDTNAPTDSMNVFNSPQPVVTTSEVSIPTDMRMEEDFAFLMDSTSVNNNNNSEMITVPPNQLQIIPTSVNSVDILSELQALLQKPNLLEQQQPLLTQPTQELSLQQEQVQQEQATQQETETLEKENAEEEEEFQSSLTSEQIQTVQRKKLLDMTQEEFKLYLQIKYPDLIHRESTYEFIVCKRREVLQLWQKRRLEMEPHLQQVKEQYKLFIQQQIQVNMQAHHFLKDSTNWEQENQVKVLQFEEELTRLLEGIQQECELMLQEMISKKAVRKNQNLPKQALDVLQSWFLEHVDRPFPNQQEKDELARRTNLTLNQINNWFINKRGRVWSKLKKEDTEASSSSSSHQ